MMLTGDNGILSRAGEAKEKTDEASILENISLAYNSGKIEKYTGTKSLIDKMEEELVKIYGADNVKVTDNGDDTINVNFTDTDNDYNVNEGVVSKAETEEEIISKLMQYFQNDWYHAVNGELPNIAPIADANSSIKIVHHILDDDKKPVRLYIYYKGKLFEVSFNNEFKATNVESKSKYALILDGEKTIEITPQKNLTWYDWAIDVSNTQDLNFKFDEEEISLKELIIKNHNDYYNNPSESKTIMWRKIISGVGAHVIFLEDKDEYCQNFDDIVKKNEVYTIIRYLQ